MIARIWRGRTRAEQAGRYLDCLHETGVRDYRRIAGNRGVQILQRIEGEVAEFLVVSFWESLDAVRAFAGDDVERAVYYPRDEEFLLSLESRVAHYEVLTRADGAGNASGPNNVSSPISRMQHDPSWSPRTHLPTLDVFRPKGALSWPIIRI